MYGRPIRLGNCRMQRSHRKLPSVRSCPAAPLSCVELERAGLVRPDGLFGPARRRREVYDSKLPDTLCRAEVTNCGPKLGGNERI